MTSKDEAYKLVDVKEFGSNCSEHIVKDHDTRVVYLLCEDEESLLSFKRHGFQCDQQYNKQEYGILGPADKGIIFEAIWTWFKIKCSIKE